MSASKWRDRANEFGLWGWRLDAGYKPDGIHLCARLLDDPDWYLVDLGFGTIPGRFAIQPVNDGSVLAIIRFQLVTTVRARFPYGENVEPDQPP